MPADAMEVDPPVEKKEKEAPPADPVATMRTDLKAAVSSADRFVTTREPRFIASAIRVIDQLRAFAKKDGLTGKGAALVSELLTQGLAPANPLRGTLLGFLAPMAAELAPEEKKDDEKKKQLSPEGEMLAANLVLCLLIDAKRLDEALQCSSAVVERLSSWNRRTLDPVAERIYFYASWAYECAGKLQDFRSGLLAAHRTACLHHNTACQATTLNLLLRNYLHYKLFDQADKLLTKASFPEQASNTQLARFLYYNGRIKALQLEYTEAHRCLQQAARKAPQSKALGFRLTVHKLGTIVQLLLGEIPDRAFFRARDSRAAMLPYLKLVQAVRLGDLNAFKSAMEKHAEGFAADGNYTLVMRLRQNVIRAGLRNISLAYSRISLADVAAKLHLDHVEDMEPIAAKAIRDGVIDATLDHSAGVLLSQESHDVYSTLEPQAAFHKRITFCLNVHNDAVKAMSYPPDAHKGSLEDAETMKERQREEQELAQSLAEEDDDEGF